MKLQEALRKVIRQFGVSVIQEKRLMSFLADYKAFEDYPAGREVLKAIATGECGIECAARSAFSKASTSRLTSSSGSE